MDELEVEDLHAYLASVLQATDDNEDIRLFLTREQAQFLLSAVEIAGEL